MSFILFYSVLFCYLLFASLSLASPHFPSSLKFNSDLSNCKQKQNSVLSCYLLTESSVHIFEAFQKESVVEPRCISQAQLPQYSPNDWISCKKPSCSLEDQVRPNIVVVTQHYHSSFSNYQYLLIDKGQPISGDQISYSLTCRKIQLCTADSLLSSC